MGQAWKKEKEAGIGCRHCSGDDGIGRQHKTVVGVGLFVLFCFGLDWIGSICLYIVYIR